MKKILKFILYIVFILIILGIIFYMVDTVRVHNENEPIFTFKHKIVDGINYTAKIDEGLGYKIIRFNVSGENEIIRTGTIYMDESLPEIEPSVHQNNIVSGESGEIHKIATFGEEYKDTIYIEGEQTEVSAKLINSKLGYTMTYYYDLFGYTGYEGYDYYLWKDSSGDDLSTMTIYDISNEEAYKQSLDKITEDNLYEEISGDQRGKLYYRVSEVDGVNKINYIYIIEENNLKLMIDIFYSQEVEEGIGTYIRNMVNSIK